MALLPSDSHNPASYTSLNTWSTRTASRHATCHGNGWRPPRLFTTPVGRLEPIQYNLASTPRSSFDVLLSPATRRQFIAEPPAARLRQQQGEASAPRHQVREPPSQISPQNTNTAAKEKCITCTSLESPTLNPPQYCSPAWLSPDFIASAQGRYSLLLVSTEATYHI